MSRRAIANLCVTALFLLLIGILHSIVNVVQRAIERGDIAARLGVSVLLNAFSGVAISLLGLIVLLVLPGLRAAAKLAVWPLIGIFVGILGAAGYLWVPTRPTVLIFLFFGALLGSTSDLVARVL